MRSEKGKRLEELLKPNSHLLILDDEKYGKLLIVTSKGTLTEWATLIG